MRVSTSTLDLVIVDGSEVHLYAPPTYLLKLTLPGRVVDEDAVEESLASAATKEAVIDNIRAVDTDDENTNDNEGCSIINATSTPLLWTKESLPKLQYDPEKNHGTLVVILRKEEEAIWQDLDLLGRLQQPSKQQHSRDMVHQTNSRTANQLITEIDVDCNEVGATANINENNDTDTTDVMDCLLSIQQNIPTYGLFQRFSNVFRDYAREGLAHEMLECPNPDEVYDAAGSANENNNSADQQNRREMRLEMENDKFDPDRYLNDLNVEEEEDMIFDAAMTMVPHWMAGNSDECVGNITDRFSKLSTTSDDQTAFFFAEESHLLATLPPHNPIQLTAEQKRSAFFSLVDIIFAYAYDHRNTDGDPTVESSWTVMILSPSLAWLENYNPPYDTVLDVMRWSIRRSLVYPYLRSYNLTTKVAEDVCQIIKLGRRTVIRCLLQLHLIMEKSESHYLFNKLYIDPLIGWIQQCEESEVQAFGSEVEDSLAHPDSLGKQHLQLGLVELEKEFFECCAEEESTSSEEEEKGDSEEGVGYESGSDSRGDEVDTADTTTDDEEELLD